MALPRLLCVVGPTASGKSDLALRVAEVLDGEIISADSVQIYRHFDIGSGKPASEDLSRVSHHLISSLEPDEAIDASQYAARARECISSIGNRGKVPVVCGGTFLWVKALIYGLAPAPPGDELIRQRHRERARHAGREALYRELRDVDPDSAERLNPNDLVRVSRALEVFELTGKALSQIQREHGFREPRYDLTLLGIRHAAEQLTERIQRRVATMIDAGWVDEVRDLERRGYRGTRAMASVGYRQVLAALDAGNLDRDVLVRDVTRVTHVYARRQRTWLRDQPVRWLSAEQAASLDARQLHEEFGFTCGAGSAG
jgi:tRNA dimethylallyltransferase